MALDRAIEAPARSSPTPETSPTPRGSTSEGPAPQVAGGKIENVKAKGGSVTFDIADNVCKFVVAQTNPGYQSEVTWQPYYIRVDLLDSTRKGSIIYCTWHGYSPLIQKWEER
ncbi:hypothetical protein [Sinosporangium siamense]|uniref:hypothetical protein n=1 Tax=Sinosporangium siamense TaxID=1367973 RepID=UPI00195234C0|nr:hypothetical protein [Sinosporangium siamense]